MGNSPICSEDLWHCFNLSLRRSSIAVGTFRFDAGGGGSGTCARRMCVRHTLGPNGRGASLIREKQRSRFEGMVSGRASWEKGMPLLRPLPEDRFIGFLGMRLVVVVLVELQMRHDSS